MHNFSDINAGAMIGIICSIITYFHMFPPLTDPLCQLPRLHLAENTAIQSKHDDNDEATVSDNNSAIIQSNRELDDM